jgi:RND family efflux transporter MFP subunit
MIRKTGRKVIAGLILSAAIATGLFRNVQAQIPMPGATPTDILETGVFTEPSQRVQLQFREMGLVRKVHVKEGDVVKAGQLLMELDDDIDQAEFERLKNEADSDARIKFYQFDLDVKRSELTRKSKANTGGAYADAEIEQAKADVDKASEQIKVETLNHEGDKIKARQQKSKLDKMKLYADFDGRVKTIASWPGELASVDKDKPAIILVKNDPCYVVINILDSEQVAKIKMDEVFQVRYPGEQQWREAKVVFIDPVAAQDAHTQQVKLELPNPENRSTGLRIQVKLPAKLVSNAPFNAALNR